MASPIRPQFFCSRPNGTLTPLVALDELPAHISLRGIPRILSHGDTQGMTSLGTVNPRAQFYVVEGVSPNAGRSALSHQRPHEGDLQTFLLKIVADESLPASQRLALHAFVQQNLIPAWTMAGPSAGPWLSSNVNVNGSVAPRQSSHHSLKKEYCSYWIRHGECDYQQQGCLFKHEMPTDPAMLEKLGLRDIPRWYREKHGIASLLPGANHHPRGQIGHGQHWKDDAQDRGMFKSIQYPSRLGIAAAADYSSEGENDSRQKAPQHLPSQLVQGQPRQTYAAGPSSKGPFSHRNGGKHFPNQHNPSAKKVDLLSSDPLPGYPSLDPAMHGNMNGLHASVHEANLSPEAAERVQHEVFVRSLQSIMPTSAPANNDYLPPSFDTAPAPSRARKVQKSRRLYQPRSQMEPPVNEQKTMDTASLKNNKYNNAASLSNGSPLMSKGGSHMTSPIIGPVIGSSFSSGPSTRVVSPSMHSSSSGSVTMPVNDTRGRSSRVRSKEARPSPGAIGTRKNFHVKPTGSAEDLIGLGLGHSR